MTIHRLLVASPADDLSVISSGSIINDISLCVHATPLAVKHFIDFN